MEKILRIIVEKIPSLVLYSIWKKNIWILLFFFKVVTSSKNLYFFPHFRVVYCKSKCCAQWNILEGHHFCSTLRCMYYDAKAILLILYTIFSFLIWPHVKFNALFLIYRNYSIHGIFTVLQPTPIFWRRRH